VCSLGAKIEIILGIFGPSTFLVVISSQQACPDGGPFFNSEGGGLRP
jgi:hypothetical protein